MGPFTDKKQTPRVWGLEWDPGWHTRRPTSLGGVNFYHEPTHGKGKEGDRPH